MSTNFNYKFALKYLNQLNDDLAETQEKLKVAKLRNGEKLKYGDLHCCRPRYFSKMSIKEMEHLLLHETEDLRISQSNKENREANIKIVRKFIAELKEFGIPTQKSVTKRNKTSHVDCDWVTEILDSVNLNQYQNYSPQSVKLYYDDLRRKIQSLKTEEANKEKIKNEEQEKIRKITELKEIAAQYLTAKECLEIDFNKIDDSKRLITFRIALKDKYLKLADAMLENRMDWTDGYSIVRDALDDFQVESPIDQEILDCLSEIIHSDEDCDGRYFRDCKYNYDVIFKLADPNLNEIYQKVRDL